MDAPDLHDGRSKILVIRGTKALVIAGSCSTSWPYGRQRVFSGRLCLPPDIWGFDRQQGG